MADAGTIMVSVVTGLIVVFVIGVMIYRTYLKGTQRKNGGKSFSHDIVPQPGTVNTIDYGPNGPQMPNPTPYEASSMPQSGPMGPTDYGPNGSQMPNPMPYAASSMPQSAPMGPTGYRPQGPQMPYTMPYATAFVPTLPPRDASVFMPQAAPPQPISTTPSASSSPPQEPQRPVIPMQNAPSQEQSVPLAHTVEATPQLAHTNQNSWRDHTPSMSIRA